MNKKAIIAIFIVAVIVLGGGTAFALVQKNMNDNAAMEQKKTDDAAMKKEQDAAAMKKEEEASMMKKTEDEAMMKADEDAAMQKPDDAMSR